MRRDNAAAAPSRGTSALTFHFVPVDSPGDRKRRNAKPQSQRYLTAARKHVMRRKYYNPFFVGFACYADELLLRCYVRENWNFTYDT